MSYRKSQQGSPLFLSLSSPCLPSLLSPLSLRSPRQGSPVPGLCPGRSSGNRVSSPMSSTVPSRKLSYCGHRKAAVSPCILSVFQGGRRWHSLLIWWGMLPHEILLRFLGACDLHHMANSRCKGCWEIKGFGVSILPTQTQFEGFFSKKRKESGYAPDMADTDLFSCT